MHGIHCDRIDQHRILARSFTEWCTVFGGFLDGVSSLNAVAASHGITKDVVMQAVRKFMMQREAMGRGNPQPAGELGAMVQETQQKKNSTNFNTDGLTEDEKQKKAKEYMQDWYESSIVAPLKEINENVIDAFFERLDVYTKAHLNNLMADMSFLNWSILLVLCAMHLLLTMMLA
jgi:hypothetical protein